MPSKRVTIRPWQVWLLTDVIYGRKGTGREVALPPGFEARVSSVGIYYIGCHLRKAHKGRFRAEIVRLKRKDLLSKAACVEGSTTR